MSGESMALKAINKINSRLKVLHKKTIFNSSATQAIKVDLHSANVSRATDAIRWRIVFLVSI